MAPHLVRLKAEREFILVGDVNIAHKEIDLKNWKSNQKNSGFLPEERAWMTHALDEIGLVDVFRTLNPHPEQYTWWSNRGQAWAKNVGWRLDYHLATPGASQEGEARAHLPRTALLGPRAAGDRLRLRALTCLCACERPRRVEAPIVLLLLAGGRSRARGPGAAQRSTPTGSSLERGQSCRPDWGSREGGISAANAA